jgi:single-stranded DNA-binding protein
MRGVNRVMLIGNLGRDPDVQFLEGNIGVAKFPLATTETFKDRGGKTYFSNRVAYRSTLAWFSGTCTEIPP